ncbi:endo-alpha-N-acetylgalactosaminidase family protein [Flexivirga alba]|uniref:Endo-alpha-N-acetylgalactosaminidase family protein n=1 Tax=Flexivirga alba TaxID=702742 RepID=A0ABW2AHY9_9MICO
MATSVVTLTSLSLTALTAPHATATPDPSGAPITPSQYSVVNFDSQSPAYPAPPSLDGTAAGAIDDDYGTEWTSAFSNGQSAPGSHWITLDVGGSFTLTGLDYSVKNQTNGPIKDFKVFATDDPSVASGPASGFGNPVATGTFTEPTSNTQVQTALFDSPVKARYVRLESESTYNAGNIVAASEIRVRATGDTTPQPPPGAAQATPVALTNGKGLTVEVGKEFPQVISYSLDGKTMAGQSDLLSEFSINGKTHTATTTMTDTADTATYVSTFADLPDLTITSTLTVTDKNTLKFAVTKIDGSYADSVDMLAIPHQSLVSVASTDPHAQLARTKISTDSTTTADRFVPITDTTAADSGPVGTPYGFVTNSQLSAGIITDATDDSAQDNNDNWNTRLQTQIVPVSGGRRAELSVGNYTYAPKGATADEVKHYSLPSATVVLAGDVNGDGAVSWEDGAIAFRDNMTRPLGADRVAERVAQHIPFNFASQATNPFLKTLDNVKRISMNTDDLGQWVLEKGYANEGHDSGHPDYGGDYNARAGGLADLNKLASGGSKYNADLAVHVNVTEAYPQAKSFSDVLVQGQVNGWDWLNQSYHIDQRHDLGTAAVLDRFRELRREAPGIKTVYIDAYYSSGWIADGLAKGLRAMGFEVATEWAYKFEGNSIWSHWANDKGYGGATNKGINSNIIRFIANTDRDVWNTDPLLGGEQLSEFEGWTGHDDYNAFLQNIWTNNLPTKFLQHFPLQTWDPGKTATFTGGVQAAMVDGKRQVSMGGATVLDGTSYLLPWGDDSDNTKTSSPGHASKMYFYSAAGGTSTWTLTHQFAGTSSFTLYKLTDAGRVKVADVTPANGKVTLTGDKATPYVLVPAGGAAPTPGPAYGAGGPVKDPGFNGPIATWSPTGGAHITRSANGDNVLTLGSDKSDVSQGVQGLTPGKRYVLSTNVEIQAGQRRTVSLRVSGKGGTLGLNSFDITPAQNRVAADSKGDTYSQRASVSFVAPSNGNIAFALSAVAGDATVTIDDVRILAVSVATPVTGSSAVPSVPTGKQLVNENFEGNQPGWGPFVKGDAGGTTDPRTSISDLHTPYSQQAWKNTYSPYTSGSLAGKAVDDVIDGNHSLKSHEENTGLVYRTVPATAKFVPGHSYRVSFKYQSNYAAGWQWATGTDVVSGDKVTSRDLKDETLPVALDTTAYNRTFTAGCGDDWVGLRRTGGGGATDFVIDDFTITDLGQATTGAACASISTPSTTDLNPGGTTTVVTSFTNNEDTDATNVGMTLGTLPTGWNAQVTTKDGNLFTDVKPGQTVQTSWLVTVPKDAAGTSAPITPSATYFNNCATKTADTTATLTVATQSTIPTSAMTATADSENLTSGAAEGPVGNVLDGDPNTIWHTEYDPDITSYPHWVQLALDKSYTVSGVGYQDRQSGGPNGRVKDYQIFVSDDGVTWTKVAGGSFVDQPAMQAVPFAPTSAKYVKFEFDNALNAQPFAAAAELRVFGESSAVTGFDPAPRPADTGCSTK